MAVFVGAGNGSTQSQTFELANGTGGGCNSYICTATGSIVAGTNLPAWIDTSMLSLGPG